MAISFNTELYICVFITFITGKDENRAWRLFILKLGERGISAHWDFHTAWRESIRAQHPKCGSQLSLGDASAVLRNTCTQVRQSKPEYQVEYVAIPMSVYNTPYRRIDAGFAPYEN